MRIVIVEDEALAARRLRKMVESLEPSSKVLAMLDSVTATVQWLQTNPAPDLLLLDIELSDGQSFDIFSVLAVSCPIIFTTAYDEHAIRAFKLNSIDYLLKPIQPQALGQSLQKLKNLKDLFTPREQLLVNMEALLKKLNEVPILTAGVYRDRMLVKQGTRMLPVSSSEVAYFFTKEKITFLLTRDNKRYPVDFSMEELEHSLNPREFFRANRQFIVNFSSVVKVNQDHNAKLRVNLQPSPGEEIYISREKALEFRHWLGE